VISSFCYSVNVLLGYYRALIGTWLLIFWDNLSVPSSGVKQCCVTAHRPYRLCLSQNANSTLQVCNRGWNGGITIIKKTLTDPSHLIILKCILMMTDSLDLSIRSVPEMLSFTILTISVLLSSFFCDNYILVEPTDMNSCKTVHQISGVTSHTCHVSNGINFITKYVVW